MGLDMYIFSQTSEREPEEIAYWRKHNALHHWFCNKAIAQELVDSPSDFNGIHVPIDEELLEELVKDIKEEKLTPTEGFFFGITEYDPSDYKEDDLQQLEEVASALKSGKKVYYDSWW